MIKYIYINTEKKNGNYTFNIDIDNITVNMKFDPGASNTIITAKTMCDSLTEEEIQNLIYKLEEYHKKDSSNSSFKKVFKSASSDEMTGYMVDAKDITIGDTTLDHFYYYFVPQNKRQVALVGNDFLDFCSYSHDICGNIKINTIDMEKYKDSVKDSISVESHIYY